MKIKSAIIFPVIKDWEVLTVYFVIARYMQEKTARETRNIWKGMGEG